MAGNKRWTKLDVEILKENYGNINIEELSKLLDRSIDAIHYKASQLSISFKKFEHDNVILERLIEIEKKLDLVINIFNTKVNIPWSINDVEYLKENYNTMTLSDIAKNLNVTRSRVQSKVWDLGLGKKKRPSTKTAEKYIKENINNLDMSYVLEKFNISKRSFYNIVKEIRKENKI
ncbi:hypothetical protein [Elizabethkingia anophelis]|uniref:hypothetical protein n=1 Tax=Elizabethkingia anophelis TaxID=1117645 RepID=UPI0016279969|nr:hypothetical protein [Elizabethkingia anophelis]MCT4321819.1 hypothetical protein [Elizabethkingia anophelis]